MEAEREQVRCDGCGGGVEAYVFAKATGEKLCLDCARQREADSPLCMEIKRPPALRTLSPEKDLHSKER